MRVTNEAFSKDVLFQESCKLAKVEPTKRQASKWRAGKGRARPFRMKALGTANQRVINSLMRKENEE